MVDSVRLRFAFHTAEGRPELAAGVRKEAQDVHQRISKVRETSLEHTLKVVIPLTWDPSTTALSALWAEVDQVRGPAPGLDHPHMDRVRRLTTARLAQWRCIAMHPPSFARCREQAG